MNTDPKNPDLDDTRFAEETDPGHPDNTDTENPGKGDKASEEELVEQFEEESFPASDPPANY
ncbi:MAG: hypothetical protein GX859_10685 [Corynebacterium humireducens]|jgi:hypothetical protein|uniref:Uncharacterized protein n=2 Tax=Corynebacterium humireducens TaxID=1223514 RepID=A0A0B5D9G3_9CORY|nr:hypothetical protein [Corynebacterium humireducens]AJE32828.1 hypothetical protein B842_04885 [Corynebacterium humireducens NBRC 106098 = DSM 45392]NLA56734.1 hypothetical protein [Corynebacterium humireducens]